MTDFAENAALDDCGCCEAAVPPTLYNRPGLSALAYRIGTQPEFLRRMLEHLSQETIPDGANKEMRPLAALTTRASDDPAIALLDAWATVGDVLTFYQERLANEGYLRTATERRSLLELARAIGYELSPGVAASTFLAFTVEDAPGAPHQATIPQGTRVQSVPPQGKMPQTFETMQDLEARAEWNTLPPATTEPQVPKRGDTSLYLAGTTTQLQVGDAILIVGDERLQDAQSLRWDFRILRSVTPDPKRGYTVVTWDEGLGGEQGVPSAKNAKVLALRQHSPLFGFNAPNKNYDDPAHPADWMDFSIKTNQIDLASAYPKVLPGSWVVLSNDTPYEALFNAQQAFTTSRHDFALSAQITRILADGPDSSRAPFGLRNTVAFVQSEELPLAQLPVVRPDAQGNLFLSQPLLGATIKLAQPALTLKPGQKLIVTGKQARSELASTETQVALPGIPALTAAPARPQFVASTLYSASRGNRWQIIGRRIFGGVLTFHHEEVVFLPAAVDDPVVGEVAEVVSVSGDGLTVTVKTPGGGLQGAYDPTTVTIFGNVVDATHGETVREVLGGGDGSQKNQRFALRKPPLTYTSASTASGTQNTLSVRVNNILWQEMPSLYRLDGKSQAYIVRIDDDGKASVIFGDGDSGARLPTGQENITATYRSGIGLDGEVDAESLTLLQTRTLGVRGVTNPLPATGAADPEKLADARRNAPLKVLILDRIVSLQDFEDFARAFAGIGKAQAAAIWSGETRLAFLTIAAANGGAVDPSSDLYRNLVKAITAACDPTQRVQVDSYTPQAFRLAAWLVLDARYLAKDVFARAQAALQAAFAFEQRSFAQSVTAAEIMTVLQAVSGVIAVTLSQLTTGALAQETAPTAEPPAILPAQGARWVNGVIAPAELLLLAPDGIQLKEMTA